MDTLTQWLETYKRAWETRDPKLALTIFSKNATYQEHPFAAVNRGHEQILRYWTENTEIQKDIRFQYEILSRDGRRSIVRWKAEYFRVTTKIYAQLDGIFLMTFNDDGLCSEFLEWWHRVESEKLF